MADYRTTPEARTNMPPGIPYIVGNEAAERFSFYGMRAILMVFMTEHLVDTSGELATMSEEEGKIWVHNFVSAAYLFPVLGAIISDWLFGKYRTILGLSLMYCVGHGLLALMDTSLASEIAPKTFLWWGLACIAVGSGGIKPCVSAHVGDQFGESNKHLLPRVFFWFYFSINLGSAISTIITPILLDKANAAWAFGVPGILMAIATFVFWLGRNKFVHIPASGTELFTETFSPVGRRAIFNLIPLYVFIAMFWCLFDQTTSQWVLQAKEMDRVMWTYPEWYADLLVNVGLADTPPKYFEILPSQPQAANPVLVLILIPVFSLWIYPLINRFFPLTPLRKIGIGMFVTIPAFALPAWLEMRIAAGEHPHINWQLLAYVLMTSAEVMISITALEFSYTQAPKKMKSFIMGLFLLSVAAGNKFTALVNEYIQAQKEQGTSILDGPNYYWFFSGTMFVTAVLYVAWSQFYRGETYIQDSDGDPMHPSSESAVDFDAEGRN